MATSTLAPVTSFLPEDWTCRIARWMDALEAEGRLGIDFLGARDRGGMRGDEISERFPQLIDIRGAGAQDLRGGRVVQQREQQVLDGDELMPLLARLYERHVQTDFEFLRDHRKKASCR